MIDTEKHYKVEGYGGVAWYSVGPVMIRDEDYEWTGIEEPHDSLVKMVMVGDDEIHEIDQADLIEIDELDYCASCGQIGCTHDGRERVEGT